jgi:phage recombination protein Bet
MSNIATINPPPPSIIASMAERYGMAPGPFEQTLKATIFPSTGTREEFAAFLMVAREHNLNPLTREIYAFPKKGGGIVPILSIDGWIRIINSHPAFDGMSFEDRVEKGVVTAITCKIFRKDRSHPIEATEYLQECFRETDPWKRWSRRMLRHKALIQAARYAFGFAGVYDPDEAERITESTERQTKRTSDLEQRLTRLAQHPPQPTPQPPPSPIPPQPGGDDEDWPPAPDDDEDKDQLDDPMHYDTREEKRIDLEEGAPPEAENERSRLIEAAHEKAKQGSRKLRWWRARLTPEQEALIGDWSGLEEAAKAADG